MSTIKVNKIENTATADGGIAIDSSGHVQVDGQQLPTAGALSNRNRIINGAMVHDQRNAGAAQSSISGGSSVYLVDRWKYYSNQSGKFNSQQNAASVTPPTGFSYYLGLTSASAYTSVSSDEFTLTQSVEGYNVADLEYGTSSAKTSTLSFYVRSSLTGTHSGAIQNGAANRSYPFSFTISAANTWEYKTITFAGDTSGTWLKTDGQGLNVTFNLGSHSGSLGTAGAWAGSNLKGVTGSVSVVGTSGATFYLTGVQLEVGEKATPFEHRSYGDELARCQRYFRRFCEGVQYASAPSSGYGVSSTSAYHSVDLSPEMRSVPTLAAFSNLRTDDVSGGQAITALSLVSSMSSTEAVFLNATSASGLTQYRPYALLANNTTGAKLDLSAEL